MMASPFDHYPLDADLLALYREIRDHYRAWQAGRLLDRIASKLTTSKGLVKSADDALERLDEAGRFYRLYAVDRVFMLDTWCNEAGELLGRHTAAIKPGLPRELKDQLEDAGKSLEDEAISARITMELLEIYLREHQLKS